MIGITRGERVVRVRVGVRVVREGSGTSWTHHVGDVDRADLLPLFPFSGDTGELAAVVGLQNLRRSDRGEDGEKRHSDCADRLVREGGVVVQLGAVVLVVEEELVITVRAGRKVDQVDLQQTACWLSTQGVCAVRNRF